VLEDQEEAAVARVKASLEDVAAGRVRTMSVEEIMDEALRDE
jgi:hypothetical protein